MNPFPRIRGGAADPASVRADLLEFHAAHPGITESTIGTCVTGSGHTGYDILADQLEPDHRVVADLGAGNGPLLERLARLPHLTRIVGVDACAEELGRVRTRDARVERRADLPSGLDAVLSHHAFYLFQPPEPVIEDLARALRPGGLFAWVSTSGRTGEHPIYVELLTRMAERVRGAVPHFSGWGDRRQWTRTGRDTLFAGAAWAPLVEKDFVLILREPPEQIVERLLGFFYSAWLCDRDELRAVWTALLPAGPDGRAVLEWPWTVVSARRTGDLEA